MSREVQATEIQRCIDRWRSGDPPARDELIAHALGRLTRLTRKMLRDFPGVRRFEETDDVLQNAAVRLCRALEQVRPPTAADFFRLAAEQIRRELLDLARRHSAARGRGAYPAGGDRVGQAPAVRRDPPDTTRDPDRLAVWTDFHRAVEALSAEERAVFELLYYQGLSQDEAGAVLGVSEATIKRRWQRARARVAEVVRALPGL